MADMEIVRMFNSELSSIYENKPPVSKAKMAAITKFAVKAIKYYKHIIHSVEKFIQKCRPEYKVPGLYVIDSIVRQSRHQFGKDKDLFGPRFAKNLRSTFQYIYQCPSEEKPRVVRVLNLWQKNAVYPPEIVQPLIDMASQQAPEIVAAESSPPMDDIDVGISTQPAENTNTNTNSDYLSVLERQRLEQESQIKQLQQQLEQQQQQQQLLQQQLQMQLFQQQQQLRQAQLQTQQALLAQANQTGQTGYPQMVASAMVPPVVQPQPQLNQAAYPTVQQVTGQFQQQSLQVQAPPVAQPVTQPVPQPVAQPVAQATPQAATTKAPTAQESPKFPTGFLDNFQNLLEKTRGLVKQATDTEDSSTVKQQQQAQPQLEQQIRRQSLARTPRESSFHKSPGFNQALLDAFDYGDEEEDDKRLERLRRHMQEEETRLAARQGTSPEAQPTNTNVLNQIQEQFKRQQEERYDPEDPGKIKQEDEDSQPSAFHLPSGQNAVKVEYPLQSRQEPEPEPQLPFLGEPQPQPNVGVPPNFQPAGFERVPSTSSQEDVMREIDRRNTSNFMQQGQPVETQYRGMNIREQRMEQQKDDDFPTFDPDDYPLPLMESRRKERDSDMEEREKRERDPDRRERESERRDRDSDRRDRESDRRERGSERRERASRYDRDDRDKDDDGDRKLKDRRDEDDRDRRRRDESRREESRSDDRSREKKAKMSLDERRHRGFPDDVRPGRLTLCSITIWAGRLPRGITVEDIKAHFEEYGEVENVDLIPPRGCAFIAMKDRGGAASVMRHLKNRRFQGTTVKGKIQSIEKEMKKDKPPPVIYRPLEDMREKMSWAPGKFIKNSEFKKHWNEELGSTFIPWDRLGDTTLESLREGGVIDPDSVPPGMEVPEDLLTFQPPEANCNDLHIMMKQQKNVEESYDDLLLAVSVESHGHSLAENN